MDIYHTLFLIGSCRCDCIKVILKESDGIIPIYKWLPAQGRYRWPRDKSEVRNFTWKEFERLW